MIDQRSVNKHANWIPDFFGFLFRELDQGSAINEIGNNEFLGLEESEADELIRPALRQSRLGEVPEVVVDYLLGRSPVPSAISPTDRLARAYVVAQCIDKEFHEIHPRTDLRNSKVVPCYARFSQHNAIYRRYSSEDFTYGNVLPKGPLRFRSAPPEGSFDILEDQFLNLVVLDWSAKRCELKIPPYPRIVGLPDELEDLKIGFVPLAQMGQDLSFSCESRHGTNFLKVAPSDVASMCTRAEEAIEVLNRRGAQIAVFPELCLCTEVLEAISSKLKASCRKPGHTLALVVAGSAHIRESKKYYNECTVLSGNGQVLTTQRKFNRYEMSAQTAAQLGLGSNALREEMYKGESICVLDLEPFGRIVILICEDLENAFPGEKVCEQLAPDWIIAPLLDTGITPRRWHHRRGGSLAGKYGSRVVVGTCMALECRRITTLNKGDPDQGPKGTATFCGIGLGFEPTGEKVVSKIMRIKLRRAGTLCSVLDWSDLLS